MMKDDIITQKGIENEVDNKISRIRFSFKDLIPSLIYWPLLITQIILVVFFYNYYHLDFFIWIGWLFMAFFMVVGTLPRQAFKRYGEVEVGKSHVYTTKLVDKGIYTIIAIQIIKGMKTEIFLTSLFFYYIYLFTILYFIIPKIRFILGTLFL